ncbi:endonuclease/exonuclease/phosphatase family protein [Nocardioides sp.]|uniref:endonuclease/exonuclease/phosphatase family protein n=1 Tax=Nocardioides sp. TaxID=35761 RepID=UPI00378346BE
MLSDARSRQRLTVVAALLLGMVLGAAALRLSGMGAADDGARLAEGDTTTPTQWTMSSLNVLGAGHTKPGGKKAGWASGPVRMKWLTEVINEKGVDVIGLQEFERPQYLVWEREMGADWDTYPGTAWGPKYMRNSVAWRTDQWSLVSGSWVKIPYFHGHLLKMPVVRLQNVTTGQEIYASSFHNPASVHGPAAQWRKRATDIQIAMVNRLREESGLPVYVLGDMNERDVYYCRMTAATDMVAASGGYNNGTGGLSGCGPTRPTYIDWIFGSPETTFSGYVAERGPKVRKSTDHSMIIAEAELPPVTPPTDCPTPTVTPTVTPTPSPTSTPRPSSSGTPTPNVPSPTTKP